MKLKAVKNSVAKLMSSVFLKKTGPYVVAKQYRDSPAVGSMQEVAFTKEGGASRLAYGWVEIKACFFGFHLPAAGANLIRLEYI